MFHMFGLIHLENQQRVVWCLWVCRCCMVTAWSSLGVEACVVNVCRADELKMTTCLDVIILAEEMRDFEELSGI